MIFIMSSPVSMRGGRRFLSRRSETDVLNSRRTKTRLLFLKLVFT